MFKFEKDLYENKYPIFADLIRKNKVLYTIFKIIYYGVPIVIMIIYVIYLIQCYRDNGKKAMRKALIIPAAAFGAVTIFRKLVHFKRPYEKYNFKPLIKKRREGSSMPSRHTFSAGVISAAMSVHYPILAPVMWILTAIVGVTRILAGVHFGADIIVALLLSLAVRRSMDIADKES